MMKGWGNYILCVVSVCLTFLFIEIGFRVVVYHNDWKTLESIKTESPIHLHGKVVSLGQIIRLSQNPRIIYELIPDLSVQFINQPVFINSSGFRGEHIPIEMKKRTIRIVGIGDSVMFGWGVQDHETYLALLSDKMNADSRGVLWEVVNTAVPGYNTVMEVETLKQKGLHYKPQIVIIEYVGNDVDLPNFISEHENYSTLHKSFIVEYLSKRKFKPIHLANAPVDPEQVKFESDPRKVPRCYKGMVGVEAVRDAMQELSLLSQHYRFEVIVLSQRSHPEWVIDICRMHNFHIVETEPEWRKHVAEKNLKTPERLFRLSKKDPHPSVIGHQVMCKALVKYLEESKLVRKIVMHE